MIWKRLRCRFIERTISSIDAALSATEFVPGSPGRYLRLTNSFHARSLKAARSVSLTGSSWFRATQIMCIGIFDEPATRCAYRRSRWTRSSHRRSSTSN